jgi:hypothetical protein
VDAYVEIALESFDRKMIFEQPVSKEEAPRQLVDQKEVMVGSLV